MKGSLPLGLLNKLTHNKYVHNKYVLYSVALVSLLTIIGHLMKGEFSTILFFYLAAMITYYYCKNMTVVLGSALVATGMVFLVKKLFGFKEGMTSEEEKDQITDDQQKLQKDEDEDKKKLDEDKTKLEEDKAKLQKTGYENLKLNPAQYNIPNKDQLSKQLGKADQMERAYDNLEKIVGESGIKSMSKNTQDLVKQQKELLNGLKEITPALNDAMGAIGKIDLHGLVDMFKSINKTPTPTLE